VTDRLYHFSEDPGIEVFKPHTPVGREEPLVWAIDAEYSFLYYFPRECPRAAIWALPDSTPEDIERFLGHTSAARVIAIEAAWQERIRSATLYVYTLPADGFKSLGDIGMHVCRTEVRPLSVEPVGDLVQRLTESDVELRITPSLWPLADAAVKSTLHFSLIRMRNATPRDAAR
jgi:Family of unknown function (DUF6886)